MDGWGQVYGTHDFWEAEMVDLFEKWHLVVDQAVERNSLEPPLREAEGLFRKWYSLTHANGVDADDQQADPKTLHALKTQITAATQKLETSGNSLVGKRLEPRKFGGVFDMETFFRQNRPIISVSDIDSGALGSAATVRPAAGPGKLSAAAVAASPTTATSPAPSSPSTPKRPAKVVAPAGTGQSPSGGAAASGAIKRATKEGAADGLREQVARRAKRKQSVLDRGRGAVTMRKARYHIVVDVTEVHVWLGQEASLSLSLYSLTEDRMVSEEVSFPFPSPGQPIAPGKSRVTFLDVAIGSIEDLHLICRVTRIGKLKYDYAKAQQLAAAATGVLGSTPTSIAAAVSLTAVAAPAAAGISSSDVKRPFAVAALALGDAVEVEDSKPTKTATHLFAPTDEVEFPRVHQFVINEDKAHPLTLIKAKGLVLVCC